MKNTEDLNRAWLAAYEKLNPEQKQAVDTIEGPVLVIAGPGTGKTQVLTLRIVNILRQTDTAPESILALTFTEAGATNMRERLRTFLGSVAYQIPIYTFHAFCEQLIQRYPEAYDRIVGGRLATDVERAVCIEDILESGQYPLLRPSGNPILHIATIQSQISTFKREAITPDVFSEMIASQERALASVEQFHTKGAHIGKVRGEYRDLLQVISRNRELLSVYQKYEAVLRADHLYDYDDMILETIVALRDSEDMLLSVQEQYQYVLADEHQDVNGSQNRILELITSYHTSPNLFVVGDEKQAIYRFQGASLENFLHFEHAYASSKTVSLVQNYRSPQAILDTAHSLIAVKDGPLAHLRIPLKAEPGKSCVLSSVTYQTTTEEEDALVEAISSEIKNGVVPSEIAVIVRTNKEVERYAERLKIAGISASASADRDVLYHPITTSVLSLLEAVAYPKHTQALITVLHSGYTGIDRADLVRLLSAQTYERPLEAILFDPQVLAELSLKNSEPILRLMDVLRETIEANGIVPPHRLLSQLIAKTGLRDQVIKQEPFLGIQLLRRLYDEAEALVRKDTASTLADVLDTFIRYRRYGIGLSVSAPSASRFEVRVLTAHKAKGLEFEVVFAPNLTDTVWGGKARSPYFTLPVIGMQEERAVSADSFDDEKRLLYVLLTRAKRALYLSHARVTTDGKERPPSRLLEELDDSHFTVKTETVDPVTNPGAVLTPLPAFEFPVATIAELFLQRGFSPTSLDNYLKSPWTYIYQNLLRVPDVQSETLLYGTAVHRVLELVGLEYMNHKTFPSITELSALISKVLGALPLSTTEFTRVHDKAFTALSVYLQEFSRSAPPIMQTETKLTARLQTDSLIVPEIVLNGKLDRLDFDTNGTLLRVVDYKTGRPKSRGVVAGTTKTSKGSYKRQLVFYALLLQLSGKENYRSRTGTISFVQPNAHGLIQEETFEITDDEIQALEKEIITSAEAIVTGSYLQVPCDPKESPYCALVNTT
jgi:DNA helicase II / ATP-dependent DNA helicase PcrA